MIDLLKQQLDYLLFLYAFSFFVIAAVCYSCKKHKLLGLQWIWLTYFGLFHGIHELLNLIDYSIPRYFFADTLSSLFMMLSFICLFEFGRSQLKIKGNISTRHLVYLPLLSISLAIFFIDKTIFLAVLKYIFCLVGGILASLVLIKSSRNISKKLRILITSSGILLILFAVFNGFVGFNNPIFSISIINTESFADFKNIPVQTMRSLIILLMAASLYIFNFLATSPDQKRKSVTAKLRLCYLEIVLVLFILSLGWTTSQFFGKRAEKDFHTNLLQQTLNAASLVNHGKISDLMDVSNSMQKSDYIQTFKQIQEIKSTYGLASKNVYLLIRENGKIIFAIDSKGENTGNYLQLPSVYQNAPKAINRVFNEFMPITYGPYTDKWGTWVSGFAPIFAKENTGTTVVIGMDLDASEFIYNKNVARLICMALALLLCIVVIILFTDAQIALQSRMNMATSEGRYASLINGSQNCITFFDIEGRLLTINRAGLDTMGWQEIDVIGKSMCDIVEIDMQAGVGPMEDGETTSFEATCRRKSDGKLMHWRIMLNPLEDQDGFCGFAGIWTDITGILEAKKALALERERLDATLQSIGEGVIAMDTDGKIRIINETAMDILGVNKDESIGKPIFSVFKISNDKESIVCPIKYVLETGEPLDLDRDTLLITKNDSIKSIESSCYPIRNESDKLAGAVLAFRDITQQKIAEEKLNESEIRYRTLFEELPDSVLVFDANSGKPIEFNDAAHNILGYSREEFMDISVFNHVIFESEKIRNDRIELIRTNGGASFEIIFKTKSGELRNVLLTIKTLKSTANRAISICRDITDIKKNESQLRIQASAIDAASDQILITDTSGRIEFVNKSFENETGFSFDEVINKPPSVLKSGRQNNKFYAQLWKTVQAGKTWRGEIINRRKDGNEFVEDMTITPVKNDDGIVEHFIAIKRNITDKKDYEAQLDHLAHHDHLTGLPNRLLFSDRLSRLLEIAKSSKMHLGVLFIDLDRFKIINDTLGHNFGDALLKLTSERLRSCLREEDTLARMGGDEFTVLLSEMESPEEAVFVGNRILKRLAEPFMIEGHEIVVSGSIGISIYPDDGITVEALVKNADTAMYKAKEQGKNNCQVYSETMNIAALKRMNMEYGLRKAIERDEFILHYQPKMDCFTGELLGAEALIRWHHPDFGLVPPGEFIQIAEESGLIIPISEWVLRTTCNQNKAWQNAGYGDIRIAVNISARHFQKKDMLTSTVSNIFEETGLDPRYLELEITESLLMQNADQAIQILKDLKSMGLSVSIDDFGTGYSSLSYLKQFPIDAVKIDRSFIKDVTTNPDDASISGAIVAMAHNLKMEVVAEGVETIDQLNFLRSIGCDEIQGYFISPPVPAAEFEHFLIHSELHDSCNQNAA